MNKERPDVDITIDASPDLETITITFLIEDEKTSIAFDIGEAQLLSIWLAEAVSRVLENKMGIHSTVKH